VLFVIFVVNPVFVSFVAVAGAGQTSLADYSAPDRMARIAAAAKKEGALTLYTTIAEKDLPTLTRPFEAKYGIKVTVWRAGTSSVLQRAVAEASAKRYDVDVIHVGSPEMEALAREQILLPVTSPQHKDLQPGSVPPHREWAATLLSVWVQAYNTRLVKKENLPKTYADLLEPKWKGKLLLMEPRVGTGLLSMASVAKAWGPDVLRPLLVDQRPDFASGNRSVADALVHGRYPIALGVRPKALEEFRGEGLAAKVKFLDLPDADFQLGPAMFYFDRAPHPAAAKLFANWMLTREGQMLLTSSLPTNSARTDVDAADPTAIGSTGKTYYEPDREQTYKHTADTQKLVFELLT